ncbi:MAG: DNA mismatch repair protein MutS [Phycisphaerae bacterium]|nr:DNA mismatch repair protein MutS [Phycisphaerae bacterium]
MADLTPAMRQYAEQKASAPDAILLFRMGDFYETFYEDAETASRVLGIALTSRDKDSANPTPLAGIPYHALDSYLVKLVKAGYKVAISEQVEDPKQAKGVVKREIVRIVTPGTLTDDTLLEERTDQLLMAVCPGKGEVGLACLDLASGHFFVERTHPRQALDELIRWRPAELLAAETPIDKPEPLVETFRQLAESTVTRRPAHHFEPRYAEQVLHRHFQVATLAGFGFERMDVSLCAAGALLEYIAETQKTAVQHILRIAGRDTGQFVHIDQATWRSLEIEQTLRGRSTEGSLLHAIDRTANPMGARCLRRWLRAPLRDIDSINRRLDAIADLRGDRDRLAALRRRLRELGDLERVTARLGVGRASPRDLVAVGRALAALPEIRRPLAPHPTALIGELVEQAAELPDLCELLARALQANPPLTVHEGGMIADGFDEELDRWRGIATGGQQWLAEFQAREASRTGIGTLKVGFNHVFGFYIEISNTNRNRVPTDYVRKQTLKNAERYITDDLKKHEVEVLSARDRANDREYQLFEHLREQAAAQISALQQIADALGQLDTLAGLAELSYERNYTRPELVETPVLEVREGRHPVLEELLGERFVPNDGSLDANASRLVLLTGPNMAGKSTYIRQTALLTLLAQIGSYVPATAMRLGPVDRIFARVGASDEIARGQSTFMVEMTEAANILNNATSQSLVILDEIGRGTSTFDGLALAWALTEHLATQTRSRTLFATHYHELTELAGLLEGVRNCNIAVREWQDEVIFLHKIVDGPASKSYGVHVAKLAGVPASVVQRSREVLAELECNFERESHTPRMAARSTRKEKQLLLFGDPAEELREALLKLDLDHLTPIEAIETLKQLQDRARE